MSQFWTCLRHGPYNVRLDGLFSQESGRTVTTTIGEYVEAGRSSMTKIQLVFFIGPHLWKQNQLIQSKFDLLPLDFNVFFDSIRSQISFVENSPRAFWAKKSILVDHYLECRWRHRHPQVNQQPAFLGVAIDGTTLLEKYSPGKATIGKGTSSD